MISKSRTRGPLFLMDSYTNRRAESALYGNSDTRFPLGFLRNRLLAASLISWTLCIPLAHGYYVEKYTGEAKFFQELLRNGLFDYADLQLTIMRSSFAGHADEITFMYAQYHAARGQRGKAAELCRSIGKESKVYTRACLKRATLATDRGRRERAYRAYFTSLRTVEAITDDVERFKSAVSSYSRLLQDEGKPIEAVSTLRYLSKLSGQHSVPMRQLSFLSARTGLRALDVVVGKRSLNGNEKALVREILSELESLLWVADGIDVAAYAELGHGRLLLNETQSALQTLKDGLEAANSAMHRGIRNRISTARMAIQYYLGEGYWQSSLNVAADADSDAEKIAIKAFNSFRRVADESQDSYLRGQGYLKISSINETIAKRFGSKVKLPDSLAARMSLKTGQVLLRAREYSRSADSFLESIALNPHANTVKRSLYLSAVCLSRARKFWEAAAVTDYMLEIYPDSRYSPAALYNLAIHQRQASRDPALADTDLPKLYAADCLDSFERFTVVAPEHPRTAFARFEIAEFHYRMGIRYRQNLRDLTSATLQDNENIDKTRGISNLMRSECVKARIAYEKVIDTHAASEFRRDAFYRLAWIARLLDEHADAAKYFISYSSTAALSGLKSVNAKYFAAYHLMRSNKIDDAIKYYSEFLAVAENERSISTTQETESYQAHALVSLAHCYETKAAGITQKTAKTNHQENSNVAAESSGKGKVEREQEAEVTGLLRNALDALLLLTNDFPKSRKLLPVAMARAGAMHIKLGEYREGKDWYERLNREFPESDIGRQSIFKLGQTFCDMNRWASGSEVFTQLLPAFPIIHGSQLRYIARRLYADQTGNGMPGLDPELVLKANAEILKRYSDIDESKAENYLIREEAFARAAECYLIVQNYDKALDLYNEFLREYLRYSDKRTQTIGPHYFDIWIKKAQCLRALNREPEALECLNHVLRYVTVDDDPARYYRVLYESGDIMSEISDPASVRKSIARYLQITNFADKSDARLRPWIEKAYYRGAIACAAIGDSNAASGLVRGYLDSFPNGEYRREIRDLM